MYNDFQQDETNDFSFKRESSSPPLPPRSTIHEVKEKNSESNILSPLYLLLGSFAFIIIISAFLYYQFSFKNHVNAALDNIGQNEQQSDLNQSNNDVDQTNSDTSSLNDGTNDNTSDIGNISDSSTQDNSNTSDNSTQNNNTTQDSSNTSDSHLATDKTNEQNNQTVNDQTEDKIHVIQAGENLYRISKKYYNTGKYYQALSDYNGLANPDAIYAGLKIKIPDLNTLLHKQ